MENQTGQIFTGDDPARLDLGPMLNPITQEILDVASALTSRRIIESFRKNDDGNRGKSITYSLHRILETELQLRGWTLKWPMFPNERGFRGADYQLDAMKAFTSPVGSVNCGVCTGWGVTQSAPANLVKPELLRNPRMNPSVDGLDCMYILVPTADLKTRGNLDSNSSTTTTYRSLARAYANIVQTTTVIVPMQDPGGFSIEEIPGPKSKKSRILEV